MQNSSISCYGRSGLADFGSNEPNARTGTPARSAQIASDRPGSSVEDNHGISLRLTTPFACKRFTMSFVVPPVVQAVSIGGKPLARVHSAADLDEGTFMTAGDSVFLCWSLLVSQKLHIELN